MRMVKILLIELTVYAVTHPYDAKQLIKFLINYKNMSIMQRIQEKQKLQPKIQIFMLYLLMATTVNSLIEIVFIIAQ